ncbi:hypothetical protein HD806DRAFT_512367 [Xylariaceae sp. AK1471]|nr:hypothetical protein HD806DRAFT_512367 [Xylariaceae sp. AK1471]
MFTGKSRITDRVDMRFGIHLLLAILVTFYILVLTGCLSTSPGIPTLFLLRLQRNGTGEVSVGYFGMCVSQEADNPLTCGSTYSLSSDQVIQKFITHNTTAARQQEDSVRLLLLAAHIIQTKVFYPLLAGSAGMFSIVITTFLLLKYYTKKMVSVAESKKARLKLALTVFRQYTFATALAAAFATAQGTGALNFYSAGLSGPTTNMIVTPGVPVQGLQWSIVFLLAASHYLLSNFTSSDGLGPGTLPGPRGPPPPFGAMLPPPPPPPPPMMG